MALKERAREGLLVRVKRWRCREGTVLKKERQGRMRGWRTRALERGVSWVSFWVVELEMEIGVLWVKFGWKPRLGGDGIGWNRVRHTRLSLHLVYSARRRPWRFG